MRIEFQIDIGLDARSLLPAVCSSFGMDECGRIVVQGVEGLVEALSAFAGLDSKLLISAIFAFGSTDLDGVSCFSVFSRHLIKTPPAVWDANYRLLGEFQPEWHGGWAPVSVPRTLVYSTRLTRPRDVAHVVEACPELVVSVDFLRKLVAIDPHVTGGPVYSDVKLSQEAAGVKLLAISRHAPARFLSASVGEFKGLALASEMEGVPGARFADIGLPVLSEACGSAAPELMRSAEPWSVNLAPAWLVNRPAAMLLARSSKSLIIHPVLSVGTRLFDWYQEFWQLARGEVELVPNAVWCNPWSVENVSSRL